MELKARIDKLKKEIKRTEIRQSAGLEARADLSEKRQVLSLLEKAEQKLQGMTKRSVIERR